MRLTIELVPLYIRDSVPLWRRALRATRQRSPSRARGSGRRAEGDTVRSIRSTGRLIGAREGTEAFPRDDVRRASSACFPPKVHRHLKRLANPPEEGKPQKSEPRSPVKENLRERGCAVRVSLVCCVRKRGLTVRRAIHVPSNFAFAARKLVVIQNAFVMQTCQFPQFVSYAAGRGLWGNGALALDSSVGPFRISTCTGVNVRERSDPSRSREEKTYSDEAVMIRRTAYRLVRGVRVLITVAANIPSAAPRTPNPPPKRPALVLTVDPLTCNA